MDMTKEEEKAQKLTDFNDSVIEALKPHLAKFYFKNIVEIVTAINTKKPLKMSILSDPNNVKGFAIYLRMRR